MSEKSRDPKHSPGVKRNALAPVAGLLVVGVPEGTRFRFVIGGEGENAHALTYADATTDYEHPGTLDSGWLNAPHWNIDWNLNDDVTEHGIYGGHLNAVTVYIDTPDEDEQSRDFLDTTDQQNSNLGFDGIYVVGGVLTPANVDAYINTLTLRTEGNRYVLYEGTGTNSPHAQFAGADLDYPTISAPDLLADTYVTAQLRLMLAKMHRQESSTRQFKVSDVNYAARDNYPMWERPDRNATDCGLGLFQLSIATYKTRETIWDWPKNTLRSVSLMVDYFGRSCQALDDHQPNIASNVFQPGLDLPSVEFNLDVMRRLNAFNRFNGGGNDRYYRWNDENAGPLPAIQNQSHISSATVAVTYTIATGVDFNMTNVTHSVSTPTSADLHGFDSNTTRESITSNISSPFDWDISAHAIADFARDVVDPDTGVLIGSPPHQRPADPEEYLDHEICFYLGVWQSQSMTGLAQLHDSSITETNGERAGFRPPANYWVKFGYVVYTGAHYAGNSGWRDYNLDGIADIDGAPFGAGSGENFGSQNRTTRYSDNCELQTDEH